MSPVEVALLLAAGLAAGFVAGLIGVGGGIIFAPVLFFYFITTGVEPNIVTPLTIGSSLFCTLIAALASAWYQIRRQAVQGRVALSVSLFSAGAVICMTRFVTTQPWYDATVFQVLFSGALLTVVVRMASRHEPSTAHHSAERSPSFLLRAGTGTAAGAVSSAVGVGGGVILVPAYHKAFHMPIHRAIGTSSATIVLISLAGVIMYAGLGWNATALPATALGYVDIGRAALLAVPSVLSARLGVWTAHQLPQRPLRLAFAALAVVVAGRLLYGALLA